MIQIPEAEKICVIIPAYNVEDYIGDVVRGIPEWVWRIIVVNDASPDQLIQKVKEIHDPRLVLVEHTANQGVGGAMLSGYARAIEMGATVLVKMDGDGQMAPEYLPRLIKPILDGKVHYAKGNRFIETDTIQKMPVIRRLGNFALSFMTKMASGYWNIMDPTNGYTALDAQAYRMLHPERIHKRYFYESSMLIELNLHRAVVADVPMHAKYDHHHSSLSIRKILWEFPGLLLNGFIRRVWLEYFILDFSIGSLFLVMGGLLTTFGLLWGIVHWIISSQTSTPATTGTVMLAAIPFTIGFELLLQAIVYDLQNVPKRATSLLEFTRESGYCD